MNEARNKLPTATAAEPEANGWRRRSALQIPKGAGLRTGSSGEGWTDTYWIFKSGCYPELTGYTEETPVTFSVTYYGNSSDEGTVPADEEEYEENEEAVILGAGTMTKAGYFFAGWNTKPDGTGISYGAGQTVYMTDDLILHAMWLSSGTMSYTTKGTHKSEHVLDGRECPV